MSPPLFASGGQPRVGDADDVAACPTDDPARAAGADQVIRAGDAGRVCAADIAGDGARGHVAGDDGIGQSRRDGVAGCALWLAMPAPVGAVLPLIVQSVRVAWA